MLNDSSGRTYAVIVAGTEIQGNQANVAHLPSDRDVWSRIGQIVNRPLPADLQQAMISAVDTARSKPEHPLCEFLVGCFPEMREILLTNLAPDWLSSLGQDTIYQEQILRAMRFYGIPEGSNIILAGHSLGGMDAQNLAHNPQFAAHYNAIEVITYGSPRTIPDLPSVKYVRYTSPTDIVPWLSPSSLSPDRSAWTFVNNPGQNPPFNQMFSYSGGKLLNLPGLMTGLQSAHLNYGISADLAQYDVLLGAKRIVNSLILDATQDRCYTAPDTLNQQPATQVHGQVINR